MTRGKWFRRWISVLTFLLSVSASVATTPNLAPQYAWSEADAGAALDLTGFSLVFSDDFDKQSVTADGGAGPWFAPVHASYGVAIFDVPRSGVQTYTINNGVLTIRAAKTPDGRWHGGNIETVGASGNGFAQKYGYFEARMKLPNMPGAWPAFWLKSQQEHTDPTMVRPEIDILEWYGGDPVGVHSTVHLWPPAAQYLKTGDLTKHWYKSNYSKRQGLAGEWHTYGALIGEDLVQIFVDRKETGRFPTLDEYRVALYPLISLTLYEKDAAEATSPVDLQVDYVRVYARVGPQPPKDVRVDAK
jgi:beta-glucanase (GH16 family)